MLSLTTCFLAKSVAGTYKKSNEPWFEMIAEPNADVPYLEEFSFDLGRVQIRFANVPSKVLVVKIANQELPCSVRGSSWLDQQLTAFRVARLTEYIA